MDLSHIRLTRTQLGDALLVVDQPRPRCNPSAVRTHATEGMPVYGEPTEFGKNSHAELFRTL